MTPTRTSKKEAIGDSTREGSVFGILHGQDLSRGKKNGGIQ
jgi:hypothetical protein